MRHLDLLVLIGFSVSLAFFNDARHRRLGPARLPAAASTCWRACCGSGCGARPRAARRRCACSSRVAWLAIGAVFLARLPHRAQRRRLERDRRRLRGRDRRRPPRRTASRSTATSRTTTSTATPTGRSPTPPTCRSSRLLPWSGGWDDLPAAHAAAIASTCCRAAAAVAARPAHARADARRRCSPTRGRRTRSRSTSLNSQRQRRARRGARPARAARRPRAPAARGALVALAGLTKFAPARAGAAVRDLPRPPARRALALRAPASRRSRRRRVACVAASATACARSTTARSASRPTRGSPFSIWGLYGPGAGAAPSSQVAGASSLAVAVAFVPRRRDLVGARRARRRGADRAPARVDALVLPLPRLVPAAALFVRAGSPGAGSCSIESARDGREPSARADQHRLEPRVLVGGVVAHRHVRAQRPRSTARA